MNWESHNGSDTYLATESFWVIHNSKFPRVICTTLAEVACRIHFRLGWKLLHLGTKSTNWKLAFLLEKKAKFRASHQYRDAHIGESWKTTGTSWAKTYSHQQILARREDYKNSAKEKFLPLPSLIITSCSATSASVAAALAATDAAAAPPISWH